MYSKRWKVFAHSRTISNDIERSRAEANRVEHSRTKSNIVEHCSNVFHILLYAYRKIVHLNIFSSCVETYGHVIPHLAVDTHFKHRTSYTRTTTTHSLPVIPHIHHILWRDLALADTAKCVGMRPAYTPVAAETRLACMFGGGKAQEVFDTRNHA